MDQGTAAVFGAVIAGLVALVVAWAAREEPRQVKELAALIDAIVALKDGSGNPDTASDTYKALSKRRDRLAKSLGEEPVSWVLLSATTLIFVGIIAFVVGLNFDAWVEGLNSDNALQTITWSIGLAAVITGLMLVLVFIVEAGFRKWANR